MLVGFTSSVVIVFQAAQTLGASEAETASWLWALGIGMGVTCIGLSLRWRMPIVTAWSTPGAAMLIASNAGVPLSDAIGAFVLVAMSKAFVASAACSSAACAGCLCRYCCCGPDAERNGMP